MAAIETALVLPILFAVLGRRKKKRKSQSKKSMFETPEASEFSHFTPAQYADEAGVPANEQGLVPGEIPGTVQIGGTGDARERYLPESHRLILAENCETMAVRVRIWDYDKWITSRYWQLRDAGWEDPVAMTADILNMDSPHCLWPPNENSSDLAKTIWAWLYPGVKFYYQAEIHGTLGEYKWEPMPSVIPVVVWANPEREFG